MKKYPDTIEKRTFTCTSCGYSAQVYGEQYFDHGCMNYVITFRCMECKIIFEYLVTEVKRYTLPEFTYDLADDTVCLWCGSSNIRVWSRDKDSCPKCGWKMDYTVDGEIFVDYKKKRKQA